MHVWLVDPARVGEAHCRRFRQWLSAGERERQQRFYFPHDRRSFLVAHGLLRELLAAYHCWPPGELRFDTGPFGRPELAVRQLRFNLAHTRGLVALAFSLDVPCGVDVEQVRGDLDLDALIAAVCSVEEQAALEPLDRGSRRTQFFLLWSAKEAVLKGTGAGVAEGLAQLTLRSTASGRFAAVDDLQRVPEAARWHVRSALHGDTHALALAYQRAEGQELDVAVQELDLSE